MRVLGFIRSYWLLTAIGIALVFVDAAYNIGFAWSQQFFIDAIHSSELTYLTMLVKIFLAIVICVFLLLVVQGIIKVYVQALVSRDMAFRLFHFINELPYRVLTKKHSADLVSRTTQDVNLASEVIGKNTYDILTNVIMSVAAFIYIIGTSLTLAILLLLSSAVIFVVNLFFDKKIRSHSLKIQNQEGVARATLQEAIQGMPIVRIFTMENFVMEKYVRQRSEQNALIQSRSIYYLSMVFSVDGIINIIKLLFVWFIAHDAISGAITIGSVLSFIYLLNSVQYPLLTIARNWGLVGQSIGASERVFSVLDLDSEKRSFDVSPRPRYEERSGEAGRDFAIECRRVFFSYDTAPENESMDSSQITDLNLVIKKGETVAIVGESGSGKSTLAKLFCGLYEADHGDFLFFGQHLRPGSTDLLDKIAYVPQTSYLFAGTIKDNIMFGAGHATDDEIMEAAKRAHAHDFIEKLPDQYNTVLGEHGYNLSGGQRQRIAIARAFIKKAPLIIMDEATSALDNESEQLITSFTGKKTNRETVVIIAHRLSTIRIASTIFFMEKGRIVESGSHSELMNLGGKYAGYYKIQFGE